MSDLDKPTFAVLLSQREWKPIRNCPGRFVLSRALQDLSTEALAGPDEQIFRFRVEGARDVVAVVPFTDGGLIDYERADGTVVHTLNTADGFSRKLRQLGITLPSAST
jgi:hypothetical protein